MTEAEARKLAEHFSYLYERWQDEREYEDFEEYKRAFLGKLPAGTTLQKFSKSPFRAEFTLPGETFKRYVMVKGQHVQFGRFVPKVVPS